MHATKRSNFLTLPEFGRSPTNELFACQDVRSPENVFFMSPQEDMPQKCRFLSLPEFGRAATKQ